MKRKILLLYITNTRPPWIGDTFPVWLNGIDRIGEIEIVDEIDVVYGFISLTSTDYDEYYFSTETSNLPEDFGNVIGFRLYQKNRPEAKTRKLLEMFVD